MLRADRIYLNVSPSVYARCMTSMENLGSVEDYAFSAEILPDDRIKLNRVELLSRGDDSYGEDDASEEDGVSEENSTSEEDDVSEENSASEEDDVSEEVYPFEEDDSSLEVYSLEGDDSSETDDSFKMDLDRFTNKELFEMLGELLGGERFVAHVSP